MICPIVTRLQDLEVWRIYVYVSEALSFIIRPWLWSGIVQNTVVRTSVITVLYCFSHNIAYRLRGCWVHGTGVTCTVTKINKLLGLPPWIKISFSLVFCWELLIAALGSMTRFSTSLYNMGCVCLTLMVSRESQPASPSHFLLQPAERLCWNSSTSHSSATPCRYIL